MKTRKKRVLVAVAGGLVFVLLVIVTASFLENALRRHVVRQINDTLQGYTVHIEALNFRPVLTFGAFGVVVVQDAFPDPPVAQIERVTVGIHWRDLLSGRVVADMHIRSPILRIDIAQLSREQEDEVPFAERGWREILEEVYPFEVNVLRISNGSLTYTEERFPPVELSRLHLEVENIRNVRKEDDVYPSPIQLEATVFGRGSWALNGRANLLTAPHPGFRGEMVFRDLDLSLFGASCPALPDIASRGNSGLSRSVA